ncbi:MAG: glycosyltransferase family protein [bacterium]
MRILYAVGSWGLGHATRSLPILSALAGGGDDVTIISTGRALQALRDDLGERAEFLDWPDVPQTVSRTAWGFYLRTGAAIPWMLAALRREREWTAQLIRRRRVDRIVSDNRLGVQHPDMPTFHIAHGLHPIAPARIGFIEWRLEAFTYRWLGHLRAVIVPDTREDRLSGDLGHRLEVFPPERVVYAGILSRLRRRALPQDVDLFVSLSGPGLQRSILARTVIRQLPSLRLRTVVALGAPDAPAHTRIGSADVYGYLDRGAQEEMMNRARIVVCRAGYSTLMELAELRRGAVLIPTPGYTEQMYLARYHHERGTAVAVDQGRLDLNEAAARGGALPPLHASVTTDESVRAITAMIRAG